MSKPVSDPTVSDPAANQSYTAESIQAWIVSQLAVQLGVAPEEIDVQQPLDTYGLDSAQAMLLASKAEKLLGFKLSPLLLWHYPTIESLSQRIAEGPEVSESEFLEL